VIALQSGESTGQIVRALERDGLFACTTRTATGSRAHEPHYHENAHLCLIVDGHDVETRPGRSYRRQAGDLHFYGSGERHASRPVTPVMTSALVELSAGFLARNGLSEAQFAKAVEENSNAPFLVLQMQHELRSSDPHSPLAISALVLELVEYSRRRHERAPPPWVHTVEQLLQDRWNAPLHLSDLASACNVHPVTISKGFRQHFGCSLGEFRRRLMVRRSLALVRESGMSLGEVAFACGFADQSHFIRTFQALTRLRPGEFQRL